MDIELDSPAYFASYDPGAPSRRELENDACDNATWDRNAPPAVADDYGDPNEDLDLHLSGQASSQHSSGTTPTVLSLPKSRGSIGPHAERYLMPARPPPKSVAPTSNDSSSQTPGAQPVPKRCVLLWLWL